MKDEKVLSFTAAEVAEIGRQRRVAGGPATAASDYARGLLALMRGWLAWRIDG